MFMKRKGFFIIALLTLSMSVTGQKYEPTTIWPYLYKDFQKGTIYFKTGDPIEKNVNIHLVESVLHYVENNVIYELNNPESVDIIEVETPSGQEDFVYIGNKVYRAITQGENGSGVYELNKGNFVELLTTTGAFGTKNYATASTRLSSLTFGGINWDYAKLKLTSEQDPGQSFPINKTYFFIINGNFVKARSKDLENAIVSPQVKKQMKEYVKKNKVKWNNPDSLANLFRFLQTTQS